MNGRSACVRVLVLAALCVLLVTGPQASPDNPPTEDEEAAKSFWSRFKDPEDGKFDVAAGGEGASGFLPVLIPFSEPAIGFGVAGALAYFHPSKEPAGGQSNQGPDFPRTTFGGGAYSDNGTWVAAVGHTESWKNSRIRYRGIVGFASANLDFYGIGEDPGQNDNALAFKTEGFGTMQQIESRLGKSRFFAGGRYVFAVMDTSMDTPLGLAGLGETDNAGLTAFVNYDSRDTAFTPSRGTRVGAELSYYSEELGGDFEYAQTGLTGNHYWPIFQKRLILGMRLEYNRAGDNAPFYALPWVKMRGIPAFRYLGNHVLVGEVEARWKIDDRWSVVGFGGIGWAAREFDELQDAERADSVGTGFRYLLARKLGLAAGVDIAFGPDETTTHIIFGSAWGI
jgi:hypothetical protein